MTQETIETNMETSGTGPGIRGHAIVFIVYAALIALFYSPVLFGNKSLNPTLYQPHGMTARGVYGARGRTPVDSFNVDLATPAFFEFPVNRLVGEMYRTKTAPLWNPFQGAGTPLAAQYTTRAFFPYQIAEDLSPVRYWDYFMLGRLFIAGFFTYLFLACLGAGPLGAFLGGLFYMFSGAFTWFINLEQLVNTAMMLPVLMLAMEALARPAPRARWVKVKIVLAAIAFALTLLAGQPGIALYVITLALLYFIFRAFVTHGPGRGLVTLPRLGISFITGLLMSAPLVLPFVELLRRGGHIHAAGARMGMEGLASWRTLFNAITPTLSYLPGGPGTMKGAALMAKASGGLFRTLPMSGVWESIGGYTGVLPLFLILSGIFISPLRKKMRMRSELFFFFFVAAFIILKNAGLYPFILLGRVPLFDRVWSLRWAGPVWVFAVAVGAAAGFAMVRDHLARAAKACEGGEKTGPVPAGVVFIASAGLIGAVYMVYFFVPSISLFMQRGALLGEAVRPYVFPSMISGSLVTLFVLGAAFYLAFFQGDGAGVYALVVLAVVELWWCVPRGYAPHAILMKWAPFVVGLGAVFFSSRRKITYATLCIAVFFGGAFLIDSFAPHGYPPFEDPFRPAPYVSAIQKDSRGSRPRVAGAYGALIPDYAGAAGLDDIRYVNYLTPMEFRAFSDRYLHSRTSGEKGRQKETTRWFTGLPEVAGRVENDGGKVNGRVAGLPERDFLERERAYSFLGVRYLVFPPTGGEAASDEALKKTFEERFPLFYDQSDARVYKNPGALPRVFLVQRTIKANGWEEAQKEFMEGDFDPMGTAVVEGDTGLGAAGGGAKGKKAANGRDAALAAASLKRGFIGRGRAFLSRLEGMGAGLGPASAMAATVPENGAAASGTGLNNTSSTDTSTGEDTPLSIPATGATLNHATPTQPPKKADSRQGAVPSTLTAPAAPSAQTPPPATGAIKAPASPAANTAGTTSKAPAAPSNTPAGAAHSAPSSARPGVRKAPVKTPETPSVGVGEKALEAGPGPSPASPATATSPSGVEKVPSATEEVQGGTAPGAPATSEGPGGPEEPAAITLPPAGAPLEGPGARITAYTPNKVAIEVNAKGDSLLVLTDLFYPGWKVKVNDEKAPVIRVNGLVRGVLVKAGRSKVVFYYMPWNFLGGVALLIVSGIFSIVLVFKDLRGD